MPVNERSTDMKIFRRTVLVIIAILGLSLVARAEELRIFRATLTGAQEVPERDTPAQGEITVRFDRGFTQMEVDLRVSENTVGTITRAHFHCNRPGENGDIVLGLFDPGPFPIGNRVRGTVTNADVIPTANCVGSVDRVINNLASLAFAMRDGLIYANVHTSVFGPGEIRGQMAEAE
jgi:hypothetical protein